MSSDYVAADQALSIDVAVNAAGPGTATDLELLLERRDPGRPIIMDGRPLMPESSVRSRQKVDLSATGSVSHRFIVRGLEEGTHHGFVQLARADGLEVDNRRYFSVQVSKPWPVLIAAPQGAMVDLPAALSPDVFECDVIDIAQIESASFDDYAAIGLLDPPPLSAKNWRGLAEFVSNGGGLAIFFGREARPVSAFNQGEPQRILPGKLSRQWRATRSPFTFRLGVRPHPVVNTIRRRSQSIPWSDFPVFRHWSFDEMNRSANVIVNYSNGKPAIIEAALGRGRVITMTTPISDPLNEPGRPAWNRLPTGPDPWPYFILVNDTFRYLVQSGESGLNYAVGETATIGTQELGNNQRLQVFQPTSNWQDIAATGDVLTYRFTDAPGTYRIRNVNLTSQQKGFSVNLPAAASDLTKVEDQQLQDLFGKNAYQVARNLDEIQQSVGEALHGRDYYPWMLAFAALALAVEFVLANRFYSPSPASV